MTPNFPSISRSWYHQKALPSPPAASKSAEISLHQAARSTLWTLNSPMKKGLPTFSCESAIQARTNSFVSFRVRSAQYSAG